MAPATPPSLKARALRLLSQREHSRAELARKLARHVQDGDDLAAVLDELAAKDLQSDTRAAEGLLRRRAGHMGVARIGQELRTKGLGGAPVAQARSREALGGGASALSSSMRFRNAAASWRLPLVALL